MKEGRQEGIQSNIQMYTIYIYIYIYMIICMHSMFQYVKIGWSIVTDIAYISICQEVNRSTPQPGLLGLFTRWGARNTRPGKLSRHHFQRNGEKGISQKWLVCEMWEFASMYVYICIRMFMICMFVSLGGTCSLLTGKHMVLAAPKQQSVGSMRAKPANKDSPLLPFLL